MSSHTADLRQVLQIIHSGEWFECSVVNANVDKQSGGTIAHLKRCRIARRQSADFIQAQAEFQQLPAELRQSSPGRNPLHSLHFTRNLELPGRQYYKVHPLFIFRINGKTVV